MYCSKCGAYIPEGETVCVACGTDSSRYQANGGAAQAAAPSATDEYRQTLEQKQREQQQKSREWAEQAYADYKENKAHSTSASTGGKPSASPKRTDGTVSPSTSKLLAGLSYVSVLCFLPFVLAPKDEFSKFHGKQGILLFTLSVIIDILGKLSGLLGFALSIFRIYLIYKGVRNVVEGKKEYLPFIGQYAEKF